MNLDQIRTFLAVADEMSISGAADRLGTTQPVVSRTIKRLEDELHATLFDRLPRGVSLSPFGKVLYAEAQNITAAHRRTLEAMQALRGDGRTWVRIGAGATWLEQRLPNIIAEFAKKQPDVRIDAVFVPRFEVIESLLLGKIDIGLAQFGIEPLPSDDVEYEELLQDQLVILARAGHPFSDKRLTPDELNSLSWVLTPSATGEERFRGLCKRFGLRDPNIHIRCHSVASVLEIVRNTDLVTLAPVFVAQSQGMDSFSILSNEFSISLSKGILTPKRGSISLGGRLFQTHLRETFRSKN